ncbi:MAG: LON peptidase substrate-binding domain-containing protein, partial [Oscillospiraceae bacterium]|nr:LON peptidase substrate-binding domain-containing protein [Oscillospiraceae bacterium]
MNEEKKVMQPSEVLPVIALRGMVMFPTTSLHFDCAREKSIAAVNEAMNRDRRVYLVSQKEATTEETTADDLWNIGVVAKIKQVLKLKGGLLRVSCEGIYRAKTVEILQESPCYQMVVSRFPEQNTDKDDPNYLEAMIRTVKEQLEDYCFYAPQVSRELLLNAMVSDDAQKLSEYIANSLPFEAADKQDILMESNMILRLERIAALLTHEVEILKLEKEIAD